MTVLTVMSAEACCLAGATQAQHDQNLSGEQYVTALTAVRLCL
jgi:hypothetical protein